MVHCFVIFQLSSGRHFIYNSLLLHAKAETKHARPTWTVNGQQMIKLLCDMGANWNIAIH